MGAEQTRIGEWLNVTGYITAIKHHQPAAGDLPDEHVEVSVQALLVWSAGPLDLQRYEQTLSAMKNNKVTQA